MGNVYDEIIRNDRVIIPRLCLSFAD